LIQELTSFLNIAQSSGLVSEINSNILMGELSKFGKELENPLSTMFLEEPNRLEMNLPDPKKEEIIKDKRLEIENKPIKREFLADNPNKPLREFGAVSVKKNSRQSVIIGLLKRKKEIMIKDVSPLISGCSEKTIQRELLAMVSGGILRKIGEKRWSKYSLA
ncbi:MAG: hypothetical protein AAB758_03000, partial [Patescibacteria group bacterium]